MLSTSNGFKISLISLAAITSILKFSSLLHISLLVLPLSKWNTRNQKNLPCGSVELGSDADTLAALVVDLEGSTLHHNEVAAPCAFSPRPTSPSVCLSSSFDNTPVSLVCWPSSVTCYRVLGTVLFPACSAVSVEVGAATVSESVMQSLMQ